MGHRKLVAPSYRTYRSSSAAATKAKQRTRARDGKAEVLLRRALWKLGLRFRVCVRALPGNPDIVFLRARTVVFCDGDFWHGRNWNVRRARLAAGSNGRYWVAKIAYNIERDKRHVRLLEQAGWNVIRLWETDIKASPETAAQKVFRVLLKRDVSLGAARN